MSQNTCLSSVNVCAGGGALHGISIILGKLGGAHTNLNKLSRELKGAFLIDCE